MQRTAILPIISVVCLAITAITGQAISEETKNVVAEVFIIGSAAAAAIWGIYKDHQNKKGDVE